MPFSKNFKGNGIKDYLESNSFPYDDDEIKVSKKIRSLRQLTRVEREMVKMVFKQASIKCLTLEDTQKYIALKTNIWIIMNPCLELLKKSEEQENREWYFRLAKDQEGFILSHKRAMDEIEQYTRELWGMAEDPNTKEKTKIKVIQTLHELTKTTVLLQRDLPFLTGLWKFIDSDILNNGFKH